MGAEQSINTLQEINTGNFHLNFPLSNCRIVVVGPRNGDDCLTELAYLPKEARIMATGINLKELEQDSLNFSEVWKTNFTMDFLLLICVGEHYFECYWQC